jgi:plastocyanin
MQGISVLVVAGAALGLGAGNSPAAERSRPTVIVVDDVYEPATLTIGKDTKVRFRWAAANINVHDVALEHGPRKVDENDFQSEARINDYRFSPRFERRGTYDLICHFHPDTMKMVVKVKRRPPA